MLDPYEIRDKIPPMKDLSADNITQNVHTINSLCEDLRLKFLMKRLVTHLHDFARETRLTSEEWMASIKFLTETGHTCTELRQEFILLSDILGLSLVVDSINHPKPPESTEGTLLGPFHTHDALDLAHGELLSHDPKGEPLLVLCTVKDTKGRPIEGVTVDIWETDSSGHYDTQYEDRQVPDGRGVIKSDKDGVFWFKAINPVPYPIPHDGPVGKLLATLHRHPYRPSHLHFMFEKEGYDHLITALYLRGDPFEVSDAVFGVKSSLLVDIHETDEATANTYGVEPGTKLLKRDFVLVSDEDTKRIRTEKSRQALDASGIKYKFWNGLPIEDVD
ncbi:Intradiol ring-cleavage dioxygenase [Cadophora sp. MPI-SDFR-AT-0126]|nr:Intradiol ring-cleavage dioxygenase [Leotiomycetes sp. MPI-SDFR-AT-0126]